MERLGVALLAGLKEVRHFAHTRNGEGSSSNCENLNFESFPARGATIEKLNPLEPSPCLSHVDNRQKKERQLCAAASRLIAKVTSLCASVSESRWSRRTNRRRFGLTRQRFGMLGDTWVDAYKSIALPNHRGNDDPE